MPKNKSFAAPRRDSIYMSERPAEARADFLLTYDRHYEEIWCDVPPRGARWDRLEKATNGACRRAKTPGLFSVLHYRDVLGTPQSVFKDGKLAKGLKSMHSVCTICMYLPSFKGPRVGSAFLACASKLAAAVEKEYGDAWLVGLNPRPDTVYINMGFSEDDGLDVDAHMASRPAGNDMEFLCDCGQFKSRRDFELATPFALSDGKVARGFYYNDSGRGCHDYVSVGGRMFRNLGYVDRGYVSDRHSGYSYYVRARNLDEKKIKVLPRLGHSKETMYEPAHAFSSLEEFALERAAAGGLRPGDSCYLHCTAVDPDGERRSISDTACWDGSKWIDYYRETEIGEWPGLEPGWRVV